MIKMGEQHENCRETVYFRKVNSKGKILLPVRVRETLDVDEGDYVELRPAKDGAWIVSKFKGENRLGKLVEGLSHKESERITHTRAVLDAIRWEFPYSCGRKD